MPVQQVVHSDIQSLRMLRMKEFEHHAEITSDIRRHSIVIDGCVEVLLHTVRKDEVFIPITSCDHRLHMARLVSEQRSQTYVKPLVRHNPQGCSGIQDMGTVVFGRKYLTLVQVREQAVSLRPGVGKTPGGYLAGLFIQEFQSPGCSAPNFDLFFPSCT